MATLAHVSLTDQLRATGADVCTDAGHPVEPRADAFVQAAKAELDPHGLMNPGALGLVGGRG